MTNQAQAIDSAEDFTASGEANMHSEASAAVQQLKAKKAGVKKATDANANRYGMQREVKGHLLTAMKSSLDDCPKGNSGRDYAELTIARLEVNWKVSDEGKVLTPNEVHDIQCTIPGTDAYKAMKTKAN